jgi:hydrogenase-4 component F
MTGPKNYKRLLAYSGIEHAGVMALGFGVGGIGIIGAFFHMMYHALAKPILFFAAGNFFLKFSSTKIAKVRGAIRLIPFSAIMFFGGVLAATGMPPFGIFFTKLAILGATMPHHPILAMIALVAFAIVFANFVRHAVSMVFGEPPKDLEPGEAGPLSIFSLVFLAVLFVILSLWTPTALSTLITNAAQIIS